MENNYCNNCGKIGHSYSQCKMPITSIGVIVFRYYNNNLQYLMIRRKETLGFIDFMRGKYSLQNKEYIKNMIYQMTNEERNDLNTLSFDELWIKLWGKSSLSSQYKNEENYSKEKFYQLRDGVYFKNNSYNLQSIIKECNEIVCWDEPEWGFPKGRRNFQEKDYECAIREFCEETGYTKKNLYNVKNVYPFEEIFTGSNYKSYKHKYYLAYMKMNDTTQMHKYQKSEVGKMQWFSYEDCINKIRIYNLEKKRLLTNINETINNFQLLFFNDM